MKIGVGLPNAIPDIDRDSLLDFAKRAEARGFSSLSTHQLDDLADVVGK